MQSCKGIKEYIHESHNKMVQTYFGDASRDTLDVGKEHCANLKRKTMVLYDTSTFHTLLHTILFKQNQYFGFLKILMSNTN